MVAAVLASLLGGCDPGWSYRTRGAAPASDGRAASQVPEGVQATATASVFSIGLDVEVELFNRGPGPLQVDRQRLRVEDARGVDLPKRERPCTGSRCGSVVLSPDKSLRLSGNFEVDPLSGPFGLFVNRDLDVLTVVAEGVTRAGQRLPLRIELEQAR